ncbi:xanthine dehydrogenase accessory protein XdhC [Alginatibacterium sediminis]|uniref:Xanthine dehydrogenase accessory protein XdhC n=1 Tax=Alginatibacterium sediminis TaxID=2164068 RepID=A0A420EGT9_9ALTE|nr:xanthine dehydrogenase accessory protein XdhC [Alginatibacterium sediminis]RKF19887.1 xanthine dehydrogenase accessory protein XdhC [Alginatibacterium sediminis]
MKPLDNENYTNLNLDWLSACQWLTQQGEAYCIATVVADVGSVPRNSGSKMVISKSHQYDTLGGGALEFEVVKKAREGLNVANKNVSIERFALAADLGQCCGGATQILFEYMQVDMPEVVVFGAGHVTQALCQILTQLPCQLRVIDNRQPWLDDLKNRGINTHYSTKPEQEVTHLTQASHIVVMTQDHQLDYDIVRAALEQQHFSFIGLIGSQSKKKRFEFRLKEQLSCEHLLTQLTCPVGLAHIKGKLPMQVAVSIAAQLMQYFENKDAISQTTKSDWENANSLRKSIEETRK